MDSTPDGFNIIFYNLVKFSSVLAAVLQALRFFFLIFLLFKFIVLYNALIPARLAWLKISGVGFEVEKFDETDDFRLWQILMKTLLCNMILNKHSEEKLGQNLVVAIKLEFVVDDP